MMDELPTDCDFLVHLGDTRSAEDDDECVAEDYRRVRDILLDSPVPAFGVIGDNDWTDCPNRAEGKALWEANFKNLHSSWSHNFSIERLAGRDENFAFLHKGVLYLGLTIVGGSVHDEDEWEDRLTALSDWAIAKMKQYDAPTVIFGHANPTASHGDFFVPMRNFIANSFGKRVLYVNGDRHM